MNPKIFILAFVLFFAWHQNGEANGPPVPGGGEKADAIWFTLGFVQTKFGAAPDSATDELKGYSEVFPEEPSTDDSYTDSIYFSIGYIFKNRYSIGITIGRGQEIKINRSANVEGTPDPTDDVLVNSARLTFTLYSFYYLPRIPFFLGAGLLQGTLHIDQNSASGSNEFRKIPINEPVVYAGMVLTVFDLKETASNDSGSEESQSIFKFAERELPESIIVTLQIMFPADRQSIIENIALLGFGYAF